MLEDLRGDRLELKMHADVSFNNGGGGNSQIGYMISLKWRNEISESLIKKVNCMKKKKKKL